MSTRCKILFFPNMHKRSRCATFQLNKCQQENFNYSVQLKVAYCIRRVAGKGVSLKLPNYPKVPNASTYFFFSTHILHHISCNNFALSRLGCSCKGFQRKLVFSTGYVFWYLTITDTHAITLHQKIRKML